jgi:hypothetical protein
MSRTQRAAAAPVHPRSVTHRPPPPWPLLVQLTTLRPRHQELLVRRNSSSHRRTHLMSLSVLRLLIHRPPTGEPLPVLPVLTATASPRHPVQAGLRWRPKRSLLLLPPQHLWWICLDSMSPPHLPLPPHRSTRRPRLRLRVSLMTLGSPECLSRILHRLAPLLISMSLAVLVGPHPQRLTSTSPSKRLTLSPHHRQHRLRRTPNQQLRPPRPGWVRWITSDSRPVWLSRPTRTTPPRVSPRLASGS